MAYRAYEASVGVSVIESIEGHCRHLTDSGTFSATGTPVLARVEQWIDQAYDELQTHLAMNGYSTAVPSATPALGFLERLNVYGAIIQVELAHPITGNQGEPNDRYKKLWDEGVSILASDALSALGVDRSTPLSHFLEVGGVSRSRKQVARDDTDAIQPRFARGWGRNPQISRPIDDSGTAPPL